MSRRWCGLLLLVIWFGRGGVADAAVTATPPALDFGPVAVGATSAIRNESLQNTGNGFAITLVPASGGDCGQFTIPASDPLPTDGKINVAIEFSPSSTGAKGCSVNVVKTAGAILVASFILTGTGAVPLITIDTPGPFDFAHVDVAATSTTPATIKVTNNGMVPLTIFSANLTRQASSYQVTGTTGSQTVNPAASAQWTVACKPQTQGNVDGTFTISSNAAVGSTASITLTCIGDQAVLTVNPVMLDFSPPLLLGGAMSQSVTLFNTGNVDLDTGTLAAAFSLSRGYAIDPTTPLPPTITAGSNAVVKVRFAPTVATDGGNVNLSFSAKWHGHTTTAPSVALTGQTIALAITTTTLAFGNFRFDAIDPLLPKTFSIVNTGSASIDITSVTFTAGMGTADAEVVRTFTINGATVTFPATIPANKQLDIKVTPKPINRTGNVSGTFTVTPNIAGVTPTDVVMTGNAIAATIAATATVDFGAVDIDGTPPKMTATITNMGAGNLDVSTITITAMSGTSAAFTFNPTLPTTARSLAQNEAVSIDVTYKPTVERLAADTPDKIVLTAMLTGALGGPKAQTLTIQGHGIDRHFAADATPAFTAFRNPGDTAPIQPLTVHNNGDAPLKLTAVMVTGGPVWEVLDGPSIDVPARGSHDVMIKFTPTIVGAAPKGQLTLTTDDNDHRTAMIELNGNGVIRPVAFGPAHNVDAVPVLDLGFAGIGIPITADGALAIINMDAATAFKLRDITLTDGSPFRIDPAALGSELPAATTKNVTVTFTPTAVGDISATATLYLDQDPEAHAQVMLVGHAEFVEAHGSGGCDAGRGGRGGGLVIGLAALGVIGRRRRRATRRAVAS